MQLSDLRSSIVKASCDVIVSIVRLLDEDFEELNSILLKPLLKGTFSIIDSISSSCRGCLEEIQNVNGSIGIVSYGLFEEYLDDVSYQGNIETKRSALVSVYNLQKQRPDIFNRDTIIKCLKKLKREENEDIKTAITNLEYLLEKREDIKTNVSNSSISSTTSTSSISDQPSSLSEMIKIQEPEVNTSFDLPKIELHDRPATPKLIVKTETRNFEEIEQSTPKDKQCNQPPQFSPLDPYFLTDFKVEEKTTIVERKDMSTSPPPEIVIYTEEQVQKIKQESVEQTLKEMAILTAEYDDMEQRLNIEVRKRRELEAFVQNYEKEFKNLSLKNGDDKEKESIKVQYTQLLIDYSKIESSFKELKGRYDEAKIVNEKFKQNEQVLKEKIHASMKDCKVYETKYNKLKEHAEEQLNGANTKLKELSTAKHQLESKITSFEQEMNLMKKEKEDKDEQIVSLNDKIKKLSTIPKTQIKALEDRIKFLEFTNEKLVKESNDFQSKIISQETESRKIKEEKEEFKVRNDELQQSLHVFYEENQKLKAKIYDKTNEIEALKTLISSSSSTTTPSSTLEEKLKKEEEKRVQVENRLKAKEKENKELLDICNQLLSKIERKPTEE